MNQVLNIISSTSYYRSHGIVNSSEIALKMCSVLNFFFQSGCYLAFNERQFYGKYQEEVI